MDTFNSFLLKADSFLGSSQWFVFLLLGTGLFFTVYLGFPQLRYFRHALRVLLGRYDKEHHLGDTSHFQSLATALSGTVGTGNIAGVALAIHLGGPAALFWMMVSAFLGMTTKFVEVSLSHKYRDVMPDGSIAGGPMYYMKKRLKMPWLAGFFAVAAVFSAFGTGSLPQVNSIATSVFRTFNIPPIITGAVLAIILALIVIGGIKRIARVTSVLVPFMSVLYVVGAVLVLIYNYQNIIPSFFSIFTDVFTGTAATGGFLGAGFAFAFNRGVNRGLFSNEAGQGSAPIAHAAARTQEPVSEGVVALLEPFIDTLIICFLTGMTLLSSGVWREKQDSLFQMTDTEILAAVYNGADSSHLLKLQRHINGDAPLPLFTGTLHVIDGQITDTLSIIHSRSLAENVLVERDRKPFTGTIEVRSGKLREADIRMYGRSLIHSAPLSTVAFSRGFLGDWGKYIVTLSLLFFAFSTSIAWSYYGDRAVIFLVGRRWVRPFHIIFCIAFFVASFTDTTIIWNLSNITIVIMTLPNLIGMLILRKEMRAMERDYRNKVKRKYGNLNQNDKI